jgi:hypothetical protein
MRLDTNPFPANVNVIDFDGKKVLVHLEQADTTKGESVIVTDEPRVRMPKPRNPEPGKWKVNQRLRLHRRVKLTSDMLLEKYMRQRCPSVFQRLGASSSSVPWISLWNICGDTLLVLARRMGVGTLRVLMHHLDTETREGPPREWVCQPENLWGTKTMLGQLTRRKMAVKLMGAAQCLHVEGLHHGDLAVWCGRGKQKRLAAVWERGEKRSC